MKITIWIRSEGECNVSLRHDTKVESRDTPTVSNYGRALIRAIENGLKAAGSK